MNPGSLDSHYMDLPSQVMNPHNYIQIGGQGSPQLASFKGVPDLKTKQFSITVLKETLSLVSSSRTALRRRTKSQNTGPGMMKIGGMKAQGHFLQSHTAQSQPLNPDGNLGLGSGIAKMLP